MGLLAYLAASLAWSSSVCVSRGAWVCHWELCLTFLAQRRLQKHVPLGLLVLPRQVRVLRDHCRRQRRRQGLRLQDLLVLASWAALVPRLVRWLRGLVPPACRGGCRSLDLERAAELDASVEGRQQSK